MSDAPAFVKLVENSFFGDWMRDNVLAMPYVEAAHVLFIAIVFGSILVVDLRLLGLRDAGRAITRMSGEMLKLTWSAFGCAVVTGVLMFAANATTYWFNTAFRLKMLAILAAGLNMVVFQFVTYRGVAGWDRATLTPRAARTAGALSILIWTTVIFLGRWIGFTKGYDFTPPASEELFDFAAGP
jgi:hypothetical protein